ncbi:MAG TPA: M48 family metallopeptidase [Chloroflexota bacterium]|nr:M48 family metallopeptidase [Chloroflexota bacterium]
MNDEPWKIHTIRSPRRTKSVAARLVGDCVEVRVPAGLEPERERELVDRLVKRLKGRMTRTEMIGDDDLMRRAQQLNRLYFEGKLRIASVRFVTNQQSRYGSCTTNTGAIRLSDRLAKMPEWVRDYVLVHELSHLLQPNHSPDFWKLVNRYPLAERARGYLMACGMNPDAESSA